MPRRCLLALCATLALMAQSDRSTINGLVFDPGGAVVPNAQVEAVNQATQVKYTGSTDGSGLYSLPQIPVGRYDLTITAAGFSRYSRKGIDVNVAQIVTINATLTLGTVDQTVEVSGAAPLILTSTAEVGTVVNHALVVDLPLSVSGNMRNPESFIFLHAGCDWHDGQHADQRLAIARQGSAARRCGIHQPGERRHVVHLSFGGGDLGIQADRQRLQRRIRAHRRRLRGLHHQERHQRLARRPVRLSAQQRFRCPRLLSRWRRRSTGRTNSAARSAGR